MDTRISRRKLIAFLGIINLLFIVCLTARSHQPNQSTKTIIRRLTLVKEPLEISFLLKGQPVKVTEGVRAEEGIRTQEFEGDPDWLKDLTLKLRNTSGKTITYVVLNLHFPEVTKNNSMALDQIFLGVDPDRKFRRAEVRLAPNETIEIPLASRSDEIKTLVRVVGDLSAENITKLWLEMHAALFDDGTLFEAGTLYKRNPDDPLKWIPIDK